MLPSVVRTFASLVDCAAYLHAEYRGGSYVWVHEDAVACNPVVVSDLRESSVVATDNSYRTATRRRDGRWEQALPRFLFRGEVGFRPRTSASAWRLRRDTTLGEVVRGDVFRTRDAVVDALSGGEMPFGAMSPSFAEGCCQHYGLPTDLIDVTSDLGVALQFAGSAAGGAGGCIAVIDMTVHANRAFPDVRLVDLTRHPWARRPRRQSAYGVMCGDVLGRDVDLKDPDRCEQVGVRWYAFEPAGAPEARAAEARAIEALGIRPISGLLDASDDLMAGFLLACIDSFAAERGPLSVDAARWIADRVPQTPLRVLPPDGADPATFATWSQLGIEYSEDEERRRSVERWSSASRPNRTA